MHRNFLFFGSGVIFILEAISVEQAEKWDRIVKSFAAHDVYYLSGYVKAFQIHGDGEPLLFHYEGEGIRGINVVMKRDIASDSHFIGKLPPNTYFDFSTPYGYGGWLLEGEKTHEELFAEYRQWCEKNEIVSEFVRFHPVLQNQNASKDAYVVVPLGKTIAMDISSPETIWENLSSKNRNMIRKAEKNGVKIYNGRYPQIYQTFQAIYNATMDKDRAGSYYYFKRPFYESVLEDLPQNAQVFYAEYSDKVIAASIMMEANGRMNYHLSGSLEEYRSVAPTNLLLYKAALWGCVNGCKTFHLGGGLGSAEDSLFHFKRGFYRGDACQFYIGKKVHNAMCYAELMAMRTNLADTAFFPAYRA